MNDTQYSLYQKRARQMLRRMSLLEKIGQMTLVDQSMCEPNDVANHAFGGVMSSAGSCPGNNRASDWRQRIDAFWHAAKNRKDNAIPILYGLDAIHGNSNVSGATVFPHNIGLGATHSRRAVEKVAQITGDEIRAIGADWIFGPNLAIAQHYHWGRTYESFSADPKQVADFAQHYITALNADRLEYPILTCAKHWIGDGATEHGVEQGDTRISERALEQHILPFERAIKHGAMSVMVSFSSWNGDKCHSHKYLITERLKKQLGFKGLVLSDMQGISYVNDDYYTAIEQSVNAGIDMFMIPSNWAQFIDLLARHVELGSVAISRINDAVERILIAKQSIGLFEQKAPSERSQPYHNLLGTLEHRTVARNIAAQSCVLVKNDNNILPLDCTQKVLVTGKNCDHAGRQCGGFTIEWQGAGARMDGATTIWQGLKQQFPDAKKILPSRIRQSNLSEFDVAVVVIGERSYAEGLGDIRSSDRLLVQSSLGIDGNVAIHKPYGKSAALQVLHPEDIALLNALREHKIPIVTVLLNGRPLIVEDEINLSDAFVIAWLPGSEGECIADLLAGEVNFTGRLAFSWPVLAKSHDTSQVPLINRMPYAQAWPPGFGFSYTEPNSQGILQHTNETSARTHFKPN
ncbi:glycoside hydrolase family 3 protein [Alteromonas sp. ASW11-36]|uniref:Glycoside hydrolase family 3 protein n=1 Tax=Alteromonas arenosi TaxID=3055817 RepID=A0ABT7SXS4_9ALTE|nr:glycoside hydrolase family 3 protein [Alteromonas sp. ASW11-36]MDM7860342.1 glycoside hydrolase family 3 protein [Alteromonas sp. ASW11-36]